MQMWPSGPAPCKSRSVSPYPHRDELRPAGKGNVSAPPVPLFPAFHKHNYSPFGDAVSVGKLQPLNCIAPICAQTLQLLIVYRSDPRPLLTRAASSPPPRPPVACEGLLYPACRSMPVSAGRALGHLIHFQRTTVKARSQSLMKERRRLGPDQSGDLAALDPR